MNSKRVWILDEGSQGHLVQARGMIRELSKAVPIDVTEIRVLSPFSNRLGRSLVKRLLRLCPRKWLFRLLHPKMSLPGSAPDMIVSSGPHSLPALEFLGRHFGCPNVFIQGTLDVPEGAVTVIMRPFEGHVRGDYIFIPLLFTEITPQVVDEAKDAFLSENPLRPNGPVNVLFIGNSSARIRFSQDDWNGMVRFVNDLWKRDGSQWLITTSYRTGSGLEALFKRGVEPAAILDAVWYSEAPRKVTKVFLGLADRVFVTMDSLTMLTEAVASGRSTYALCPGNANEESSNTHLRYVRELIANGLVQPIHPGRDGATPAITETPREIDYSAAITKLLEKTGWNP